MTIEQSTVASHVRAQDAKNLTGLIAQFQLNKGAAPVRLAPQMAAPAARSASSPARSLVNKLAGEFHNKPSPQVAATATGSTNSNWEEFQ